MPKYVAFLRAINVSGRFVKMAVLAEHFHTLGYSAIQTHINSGNVVFQASSRRPDALARTLQEGLVPLLGYKSEAFVRTVAEVHAIARRAQSLADQEPSLKEVNVAFLGAPLNTAQQTALQALQTDVDSFVPDGCEVYWLCRVKQSDSRFSNALFERKLKIRTTIRRVTMLQGLSAALQNTTNDV